ncbi:MAG: NosD domain-containing protein, partial [Acidimicrobiia bacterium]|nr:NosD domain-containing protein [Acidimicrobiia bacterium]
AIEQANANAGEDVINFSIGVSGPATITVSGSSLPSIAEQLTIDGTTQPGYAGQPLIELTWGGGEGTSGLGLQVSTHSTIIKGLAISGFGTGVQFDGSGPQQNQILDSFIGTADGIAAKPNTFGIKVVSCCNLIGPNNVISGNSSDGVLITGSTASGNSVFTNLIGTTAAGVAPLGNNAGISLQNGTTGNLINANTIAGNLVGIVVQAPGNRIMDNDIGLDGVGNVTHGVLIDSNDTIVGVQADGLGLPNRIVGNGSNGVMVLTGIRNRISNNVIRDNGGLGIELSNEGVTPNDLGDGDTGPNNLQNFPVLTHDGAETLTASVDGAAAEGTLYRFELFEVSSCDSSLHGEGDFEKGSGTAAADANGDASASFAVAEAGIYTATVTDVDGNTSEFSECLTVDEAVPAVVDTLEVTVDQATSGPGATSVNLIAIPIEAVFGAAQGSSTSASPLGAVPLGAVDLGASPLGAIPLGAVPLGAVPLGSVPLGSVPLGAVTVDYAGGWSALLDGTPFDGRPLQTILLSEVIAYAAANPTSTLAGVTIAQVALDATPLGAVSLLSLALGALPLGAVSPEACTEASSQGFLCNSTTTTLLELELSGFDVASAPLGAVPLGAVPLGSVPLGAIPLGSVPLGAIPLGSVPLGAIPLGSVPLGAIPLGAVPLGAIPLGAVPLGSVPLGAVDLVGTPLGAVPLGAVGGCLALDCVALGLTDASTLHDAAVAWESESSNSTTLAASPLGAVPLGAIPLGAIPLGAIPLGAVPLGAVDLAGTPLGAVPLGAVGGCDLLTGFALTCASLGADGDTNLYELAVLLEAAGSSLAASPLGAVTLDQLPLGAIDPLVLLGLDATLADIFAGTTLADVTDWGDITLGQIIIAMLIVADYPWEELEFDELGVQDFAASGAVIAYTAHLDVSGGPGLVEVMATLPDGYRYQTGTSTLNESSILDPVVDQAGNVQTLRFFVTVGPGPNDLAFEVAPGLRLATSTIDVAAGGVTALDAAPHTVVEAEPFAVVSPNVLYFGYITTRDDVDTYQIVPPGEGFRTSVFLGHLS